VFNQIEVGKVVSRSLRLLVARGGTLRRNDKRRSAIVRCFGASASRLFAQHLLVERTDPTKHSSGAIS
jgi:hypothetical protein